MLDYLVTEFKKSDKIHPSKDKLALQRLREAAEKAKVKLSSTMQTEINLTFITADASGAKHFNNILARSKFDSESCYRNSHRKLYPGSVIRLPSPIFHSYL